MLSFLTQPADLATVLITRHTEIMKFPRLILYMITFGFHCLAEDTKGYTILSEAVGKNNPFLPGQNYMFLEKWKPRSGTIYAKITDYAHYKLVVGEVATNNDDRDFIGSTFEMEATGGSIPNSPLNGQVVNAYTSRSEVNMFFDRKMKEFRESRSGPPAYEFVGTTMATLGSFKAQDKRLPKVK